MAAGGAKLAALPAVVLLVAGCEALLPYQSPAHDRQAVPADGPSLERRDRSADRRFDVDVALPRDRAVDRSHDKSDSTKKVDAPMKVDGLKVDGLKNPDAPKLDGLKPKSDILPDIAVGEPCVCTQLCHHCASPGGPCVPDTNGVACLSGKGTCWSGSCCPNTTCWNGSSCQPLDSGHCAPNGGKCTPCQVTNPCQVPTCVAGTCGSTAGPEGVTCLGGVCHGGACCTGCWDGNKCQPGNTLSLCGKLGKGCVDCSPNCMGCAAGQCGTPSC